MFMRKDRFATLDGATSPSDTEETGHLELCACDKPRSPAISTPLSTLPATGPPISSSSLQQLLPLPDETGETSPNDAEEKNHNRGTKHNKCTHSTSERDSSERKKQNEWKASDEVESGGKNTRRRIADLECLVASQQETIRQLRDGLASIRSTVSLQADAHAERVQQLHQQYHEAFVKREQSFNDAMENLRSAQKEAEDDKVMCLLDRLACSQEHAGRELLRVLNATFLPLSLYATRLLTSEQMKTLQQEEASLRTTAVANAEARARRDSFLDGYGAELIGRLSILAEWRAFFCECLVDDEAAHRQFAVEADEGAVFPLLTSRFVEELVDFAPAQVLNSKPLRQQNPQEEFWEALPDARRELNDAGAIPQGLNHPNDNAMRDAVPEEVRRDERVYIQDENKKEQTFVGGGVLFHLRSRGQQTLQDNPNHRNDGNEGAVGTSKPVLLSRFEVVFDEPLRAPEDIAGKDPADLEDTLLNVHIQLWYKLGSFLVSNAEAKKWVAGRLKAQHPHASEVAIADAVAFAFSAKRRWHRLHEVERQHQQQQHHQHQHQHQHLPPPAAMAEREQERPATIDNANHNGAIDTVVPPYGQEAIMFAAQFADEEKARNLDKALVAPNVGADTETEDGWRRLYDTVAPQIHRNTTVVVPAGPIILQPDTEYSFFLRVENKKVLNFTKRVLRKVVPSEDGVAANATYTFDEETDPKRFYYSPLSYKKGDGVLEMTGCRWNSRTADHFYKLAPRNDDVFNGRIVYHVL